MAEPRLTTQVLTILALLLDDPTCARYGLELSAEAGIKSGVIYPALARLERAGWLESSWEAIDPAKNGRPRRRLYLLTESGREHAHTALAEHAALLRLRRAPSLLPRAT